MSVHELRHTFVSLAGRGVDIQALQLMLGHASATQTIDLYQHLTADVLQEAAAMVDSRAHLVSDVSVNVNQLSTYAGESKASRKRDARNPLHNPLQNEKSG
ncbi:MAG: site-specific tyrosine recombinase XerC [Chloroflexi bacterium ADurb.Bin180]|nr:MAG: site-specific tyrosine recombinase XerC [Chloroflexi bacterium ADurb.Bin180]